MEFSVIFFIFVVKFYTNMKKHFILAALFLFVGLTAYAQKSFSVYAIGFYNQENLFDTCHDVGKNDFDFLPDGQYRWNKLKYESKLRNMARVLSEMGSDIRPDVHCAVIGLSEVENANALTDLINQEPLKKIGYQFAHIEGPDRRGVDCAMLYDPAQFQLDTMELHPYVQELEKDSAYRTRGFLAVSGKMAGEPVTVIVCHWPSRFSGSFYRESAGRQVRVLKDSLQRVNPETKFFVMGDMNDDPMDRSMSEGLGAKPDLKKVKDNEMFNPFWNILKSGTGTLRYDGGWNLFDQIVMSPNLLDRAGEKNYEGLTYLKSQIFRRDYLFQTEGKYKGNPKRTTAGGVWLDGYSDHLPVVVYVVKEQK